MSLIAYGTKFHFAENVLEDALEAELELLGISRPFIVCDHSTSRPAVLNRLFAALSRFSQATLFDMGGASPAEAEQAAAAALYEESEADGLIAFGGVAAINFIKVLGVRVSHPGGLDEFAGAGGGRRIRNILPASIAIPTAANSCVEATSVATLAMGDGSWLTLTSPHIAPSVVICDPTLTLDLSSDQMASAGMDTLTHCLETFIATAYNPPADGMARDGIRRIVINLERAADYSDLTARREIMAAALNGALASQKGLGGVHALSQALASLPDTHADHGAINAILLPLVLDFNAPAVAERYDEIGHEFGLADGAELPLAIVRMRERLGLPSRLSELGFVPAQLDETATLAAASFCNRTNPRLAAATDYKTLLNCAL